MAKKNGPVQRISNNINEEFNLLHGQLGYRIKLFGTNQRDIDKAFTLVNYEERFKEITLVSMMEAATIGYGAGFKDVNRARNFYSRHRWPDGISLSTRIVKGTETNKKIVKLEVSRSINSINAWNRTAKNITNTELISGDIAGHMWEVIRHGRRNLKDTPATAKLYERAVRNSQRQIERLALDGAPTKRLKKAYQAVIEATESGSATAINSAIDRATKAKANYNAQRIARTETARAYGDAFFADAQEDELVAAYRSVLSSRHPKADICDVWAEADFYGLGGGVYPVTKGPPYPYHPHCICILEKIYAPSGRKTGRFNKDAGKDYYNQHPRKARIIMGKGNSERFIKNKDKWRSLTPNYNDMERHEPKTPVSLFKEKG